MFWNPTEKWRMGTSIQVSNLHDQPCMASGPWFTGDTRHLSLLFTQGSSMVTISFEKGLKQHQRTWITQEWQHGLSFKCTYSIFWHCWSGIHCKQPGCNYGQCLCKQEVILTNLCFSNDVIEYFFQMMSLNTFFKLFETIGQRSYRKLAGCNSCSIWQHEMFLTNDFNQFRTLSIEISLPCCPHWSADSALLAWLDLPVVCALGRGCREVFTLGHPIQRSGLETMQLNPTKLVILPSILEMPPTSAGWWE